MSIKRAAQFCLVAWLAYLAMLVWIDSRTGILDWEFFVRVLRVLPILLALAAASLLLRYARWRWLFIKRGMPWSFWRGLPAYLTGFAFTVTPGKLGELIRARYMAEPEVPAKLVVSAFFYERSLDLLAVLLLSTGLLGSSAAFGNIILFVGMVLAVVLILLVQSVRLRALARVYARRPKLSATMAFAGRTAYALRVWLRPRVLVTALLAGILAWSMLCMAFVLVLEAFQVDWIESRQAFAIYPFAMLAGAASMLPGGVGTTEAAMAVVLQSFGVTFALAAALAIVIRFTSMWFAVICGFTAIAVLEVRKRRVERLQGDIYE